MFPLNYVKKTLIYLLNQQGYNNLTFVRNCEVLIKNNYIDESNALGSILITIITELLQNKSIHEAVASVVAIDFTADEIIESLKTEQLTQEEIAQLISLVQETVNTINITKNVKIIQDLSTKILNRELKSTTEIKKNFQVIMSELINVLVKLDKNSAEDKIEISSENIDQIIERVTNYYQQERIILNTELTYFDQFLNGGLHSSRLYTFAMKSGDGKSTVMLGLAQKIQKILKQGTPLYNIIMDKINKDGEYVDPKPTIYYFTFENSIDESLERYLPGLIEKPIRSIKDIIEHKDELKQKLSEMSVMLDMEYRGGFTTSPIQIIQYIEKEKVKGKVPVAIFIDYLGIMISDSQRVEKRLQLEEITAGLKNIAVLYGVPVITGVQVKKDSFDKGELSLSDIKESSGIIDNSDVVIAAWQGNEINQNNASQKELFMKIEKQRNYVKGVKFKLGVDFSTYSLFNISDDQNQQEMVSNAISSITSQLGGTSLGSLM